MKTSYTRLKELHLSIEEAQCNSSGCSRWECCCVMLLKEVIIARLLARNTNFKWFDAISNFRNLQPVDSSGLSYPKGTCIQNRLALLFLLYIEIVYSHHWFTSVLLFSDITLRYKEIRRQKQEHKYEKDKCLSNGDGHSSILDEQNGNKLRERKLWGTDKGLKGTQSAQVDLVDSFNLILPNL